MGTQFTNVRRLTKLWWLTCYVTEISFWHFIFRTVKNSVADFFGVGDEDCQQAPKWQNRHMRYYRGKVKEGFLKQTTDFDELDSSIRYIHDPLKAPGGRHSTYSRRTTPLSSTSTYTQSTRGFPQRRTRKDSVLKMTWKGMQTITVSSFISHDE